MKENSKIFRKDHFAMILKYLGVSFITGSLSHGFFSGSRAIIFAGIGVIAFTIGSYLEKKDENHTSSILILIVSAIMAVGVGAFTGGLQHFIDSPERSLWIAPLGFVISIATFAFIKEYTVTSRDWTYIISSSVAVGVVCYMFFISIRFFGLQSEGGHGDDGGHTEMEIEKHEEIKTINNFDNPENTEKKSINQSLDNDGHSGH